MFGQALERFRVVFGECGEHFAVEFDVGFLERVDESGIGKSKRADCRIDAERPEIAVLALLGAAVTEGVYARVGDSFFGHALLAPATESVAFHLRKHVASAFQFCSTSFDARHIVIIEGENDYGNAHLRIIG